MTEMADELDKSGLFSTVAKKGRESREPDHPGISCSFASFCV